MKTINSASLVCSDLLDLRSSLRAINNTSYIDSIHIDIMDGLYVDRIGIMPEVFSQINEFTNKSTDVHFMVDDPVKFMALCQGADMFWVHSDKLDENTYKIAKSYAKKCGVVFSPGDDMEAWLSDGLYDSIILMAMRPGDLSSDMDSRIYDMIKIARKNCSGVVAVDGKVSRNTYVDFMVNGANFFVLGTSSIYQDGRMLKTFK